MVGKTRARRRMGQEQQRKASLHRFAVTRGGNGPRRIIEFARGPDAGIPDIDVQAQTGVRRPLPQRAEAYLIGIGRHGAARRNNRQKKKQQQNEDPDGGKVKMSGAPGQFGVRARERGTSMFFPRVSRSGAMRYGQGRPCRFEGKASAEKRPMRKAGLL